LIKRNIAHDPIVGETICEIKPLDLAAPICRSRGRAIHFRRHRAAVLPDREVSLASARACECSTVHERASGFRSSVIAGHGIALLSSADFAAGCTTAKSGVGES